MRKFVLKNAKVRSRFRGVGTVGPSRPSGGIVDSCSCVEIMRPLGPWEVPGVAVSGVA